MADPTDILRLVTTPAVRLAAEVVVMRCIGPKLALAQHLATYITVVARLRLTSVYRNRVAVPLLNTVLATN